MNYVQRKPQRIRDYDYSQNGAYFVTLCTQNKLNIFEKADGDKIVLNDAGLMVSEKLSNLSNLENIRVDKYVVMPNHVHAIISVSHSDMTAVNILPTISDIIKQLKTVTTKLYIDGVKSGKFDAFSGKVWQKSFYDHVIRNDAEYQQIWIYIDDNPRKWAEDGYYMR